MFKKLCTYTNVAYNKQKMRIYFPKSNAKENKYIIDCTSSFKFIYMHIYIYYYFIYLYYFIVHIIIDSSVTDF